MLLKPASGSSLVCAVPLVSLALATLVACGTEAPAPTSGGSSLAPSFAPEPGGSGTPAVTASPTATGAAPSESTSPQGTTPRETRSAQARGKASGDGTGPAAATGTPAASARRATPPARASLTDRTGDVRSIFGAPAYADLVAAEFVLDGGQFTLDVTLAEAPPTSLPSDEALNVVAFTDVDGDGQVDYELWATLTEGGWTGSYRFPDGARYADDSGVAVRASGRTVRLGFPASHLARSSSFRWSVAGEYGTLEQISSGTSAKDYAPDSGAAAFPG